MFLLSGLLLAAGCHLDRDPCRPGTICTIAGTGDGGYDDRADQEAIPALQAEMYLPQDTLTGADGALYFLDWNNHRLRRLDPDGKIRWVAGNGELGGPATDPAMGALRYPSGLTFSPSGQEIILAGWRDGKIWSVDVDSGALTRIAGDGRRDYTGDGGPALESSMDLPASVAFDPRGDLVVMDQINQVLRTIDTGGTIHRLAGQCVIDQPAPGPGPCDQPVPCPGTDKLTCGDPGDTCLRSCNPSYAGDGAPATKIRMGQPYGAVATPAGRIAFDAAGDLYFADTANDLIRMIDTDGIVHRVAGRPPVDGMPQAGYAGDGGDAREAVLNGPVDLALAPDGTLYFTDVYNHCVRAVDPAGIIRTVAGQCGTKGYEGDGHDATTALLRLPFGVEWADGHLNIADTGNHVIRRVELPVEPPM